MINSKSVLVMGVVLTIVFSFISIANARQDFNLKFTNTISGSKMLNGDNQLCMSLLQLNPDGSSTYLGNTKVNYEYGMKNTVLRGAKELMKNDQRVSNYAITPEFGKPVPIGDDPVDGSKCGDLVCTSGHMECPFNTLTTGDLSSSLGDDSTSNCYCTLGVGNIHCLICYYRACPSK